MSQDSGVKNTQKGNNFRSSLEHRVNQTRGAVGHHGLQREVIKSYSEVAKLGRLQWH